MSENVYGMSFGSSGPRSANGLTFGLRCGQLVARYTPAYGKLTPISALTFAKCSVGDGAMTDSNNFKQTSGGWSKNEAWILVGLRFPGESMVTVVKQ